VEIVERAVIRDGVVSERRSFGQMELPFFTPVELTEVPHVDGVTCLGALPHALEANAVVGDNDVHEGDVAAVETP
jgi:hypothetical protein